MIEGRDTIRLDKWLWQARFFKSRSLAAGVVTGGKVRIGGQPAVKPARAVGAGDVLTFQQNTDIRIVKILACGTRRGPAPEAQTLLNSMGRPPASQKVKSNLNNFNYVMTDPSLVVDEAEKWNQHWTRLFLTK